MEHGIVVIIGVNNRVSVIRSQEFGRLEVLGNLHYACQIAERAGVLEDSDPLAALGLLRVALNHLNCLVGLLAHEALVSEVERVLLAVRFIAILHNGALTEVEVVDFTPLVDKPLSFVAIHFDIFHRLDVIRAFLRVEYQGSPDAEQNSEGYNDVD